MKASVLMVSKPVVPPWDDSSKNLVKDLVLGTSSVHFKIMTAAREASSELLAAPQVELLEIYREAGKLAPSLRQNLRVVRTLLKRRLADLHHFFFAPNPRTLRIVRALRCVNGPPAIHTICSVPARFEGIERLLFADVHVALSRYTKERLEDRGVPNVRYIPPCIPPIEPCLDEAERQRCRVRFGLEPEALVVLFPGDYEFSATAHNVAEAALKLSDARPSLCWVFACRLKGRDSSRIESEIRQKLAKLESGGKVLFLNRVEAMHELIAASDLVVLPSESTYAKMDLPLVLLEAMAIGRPIVVADRAPLNELPIESAGWSVRAGSPTALAELVADLSGDRVALEERGRQAVSAAKAYQREEIASQYAELYQELTS